MIKTQSFLCNADGMSGKVLLFFSGGATRSLGVARVGQESTPHITIPPAATQVICSLKRVLSNNLFNNCVPVFFFFSCNSVETQSISREAFPAASQP